MNGRQCHTEKKASVSIPVNVGWGVLNYPTATSESSAQKAEPTLTPTPGLNCWPG